MGVGALQSLSQENNIFSVPRPDSLMENLKQGPVVPRLSAKSSRLNINENLEVAERSCRVLHDRDVENPCLSLNNHNGTIVVGRDPASKRKRLSDEVESIGCLCAGLRDFHTQTDEKLTPVNDTATCSQMVEELNASGDGRCSTAVLLHDMHAGNCRSSKKGKVYLRQAQNLQPDSRSVKELTGNLEPEISKDDEVLNQNVSHANFKVTDQSCGDEAVDIVELNQEAEVFPEYLSCDYIAKLLEYDDPVKEERFRMAMETPLSPSLPEIEMPNMEACQLDDKDMKFKSSSNFLTSTLHQLEGSNCITQEPWDEDVAHVNLGFCADTTDTCPPQLSKNSTEMRFTEQISVNEVMEAALANSGREEDKNILKYFVAFPDTKDKHCISRIISAFEICISKCSLCAKHVWMVNEILVALAEEDMLPKERACVFFSLLLSNFLVVTSVNYKNSPPFDISSCSDSFLTHMRTVMSDTGLRNMFVKQLDLDTLLSLIGSFLVDKQVMIYHDVSSQPHLEREVQIITLINGKSTSLWTETATTDKLVAGSFILAAICATTGHIGFLCETSYKILQMHRSDSYLMLTVLHVFASLCGSKYIGMSSHSMIMTVIRCIVTLLEGGNVAINAMGGSYMQCGNESQFRFPPCAQCLFSNGVASVDEVLSLLLDRIQGYAVTEIGNQPKADVSDVFSLVELLAYYMSWDWTRSKIIPQLLKIVESCVREEILTATILLIGQLGRLGIDDGRCEQVGVEELRCNLVVIFNRNFRLPTQVAIMHALIGLLPSNFGNILKNEELPSDGSENVHASLVRTWFSQLTEEQKSLSVGILHSADEIGN